MHKSNPYHSTLRLLIAVIFALLLFAQQVPSAKAQGGVPELLTFEDQPINTPIYQTYHGVTFVGGNNPDYHPITIIRPAMATASPSQALQWAPAIPCEFSCFPHLTMQFALPQSRVSISTGIPSNLSQPIPPLEALMEGFQGDPTQGGALIVRRWTTCLGPGPTPITTPLEIDDSATRITYVRLSLVDCSQPYNVYSGPAGPLILDNLLYDRPLNPPPRDTTPPILTITYPTMNAVITGSVPGEIALNMQARLVEESPFDLSVQVNGTTLTYSPVGVLPTPNIPNTYSITVFLTGQSRLRDGSNTVTLTATDFDPTRNTGTATVAFTFHPKPIPPPSQVDILPTAFEVTQSIDLGPQLLTHELANPSGTDGYRVDSQSLIQGKATLIRVYAAASGTTSTITNVPASYFVRRDRCNANCVISDTMPPMSGWLVPAQTPIFNTQGISIPALGSADSEPFNVANQGSPGLNKTWNFYLAPDWTAQDLVVFVTLNSGHYSNWPQQGKSVPECDSIVMLACQHNNEVEFHLHFQPANTIIVDPVYIHVKGKYQKGNQTHSVDKAPTSAQFDAMIRIMNELFPMNVLEGPAHYLTVDPNISGKDLTDEITDISGVPNGCFTVGKSSIFYLGIFPGDQGPGGALRQTREAKTQARHMLDPTFVSLFLVHGLMLMRE